MHMIYLQHMLREDDIFLSTIEVLVSALKSRKSQMLCLMVNNVKTKTFTKILRHGFSIKSTI